MRSCEKGNIIIIIIIILAAALCFPNLIICTQTIISINLITSIHNLIFGLRRYFASPTLEGAVQASP